MISGQEEKKTESTAVITEAVVENSDKKENEVNVESKSSEDEVKKAVEVPENEEVKDVQTAEPVPVTNALLAKEETPALEEARNESPAKEQPTAKTQGAKDKSQPGKDNQTDLEMGASATASQQKDPGSLEPSLAEIYTTVVEKMNANGGWAWFAFFCSVILMIDASTLFVRFNPFSAFAVSFSVINICASLTFALLGKYEKLTEKSRELFVVIFYVWTLIGVGIITFAFPFFFAGNGYFAAWGTMFAAHMMIKKEIVKAAERIESLESKGGYLFFLFFSSCVNLFAGIGLCNSMNNCGGYNGWNLAVGLVSAVLCLVLQVVPALGSSERKATFGFLVVWWVFGVALLTFPIIAQRAVGNAYISSWACLALSCILLFLEIRKEQK